MELIVTTGVPIVCFIFGFIFGYKLGRGATDDDITYAVKTGFKAGQESMSQAIMQAYGNPMNFPLDNADATPDTDNQDKACYGFDLTKR